jgi:hypothetical protein
MSFRIPSEQHAWLRPLSRELVVALLAFGGYLSLSTVFGYIYRWAFLDVFGAASLLGLLAPTDILFGTARSLGPLVAGIVIFLIGYGKRPSEATSRWISVAFFMAGSLVFTFQSVFAYRLLIASRAAFCAIAAGFLLIGIAFVIHLTILDVKSQRAILAELVMLCIFAFVYWPIVTGYADGFRSAAEPAKNLPRVTLRNQQVTLYLLFASNERLYCARASRELAPAHLQFVQWSSVAEIYQPRER